LLRFLIANKSDVSASAEKFRAMLAWRQSNGVDAMRRRIVEDGLTPQDFPHAETVRKYWNMRLFEFYDEEGNPVCWDTMGDISGMVTELTEDEIKLYMIYFYEWRLLFLHNASVQQNALVGSYEVKDLADVGLSALSPTNLSLLQMIASISSNNYVETTRCVALLNCGWAFSAVWSAVSYIIPERTLAKISIINDGPAAIEGDVRPESIEAPVDKATFAVAPPMPWNAKLLPTKN